MTLFFFSIPAYGHTNPTLPLVTRLNAAGHTVRYYSISLFQKRIEETGAIFVNIEPWISLTEKKEQILQKASAMTLQDIAMTKQLTRFLDKEIETWQPDGIISDSVCFWGKLQAMKHSVPWICSTTTFAYNQYSSRYLKHSFAEILDLLLHYRKMQKALDALQSEGYPACRILDLIQNDAVTPTIVYTLKDFQPCSETFGSSCCFAGPSVRMVPAESRKKKKWIYISLGTVVGNDLKFFQEIKKASSLIDQHIVIAAPQAEQIIRKWEWPENVEIHGYADQLEMLSHASLFITHAGMNSVNEAIYMGVPLILVPHTNEQRAVAARAAETGIGIELKKMDSQSILQAIDRISENLSYQKNISILQQKCRQFDGLSQAVQFIESVFKKGKE